MPAEDDFTVTPYAVTDDVDYDQFLNQFGVETLTDNQITRYSANAVVQQ